MSTTELIKFVQTWLTEKGYFQGAVNGNMDPSTLHAISKLTEIPSDWSGKRKLIGSVQLICKEYGVDPGPLDGYWGPDTKHGYETVIFIRNKGQKPPVWRPEEITLPVSRWPKQFTQEFDNFYGPKGSSLVIAQSAYPLKLSWNPSQIVNRFTCHQKVKTSVEKVLNDVLDHYGIEEIKRLRLDFFGGCYNDRAMRGGTKPSMHSWGIALDFDPKNNDLHWGRDRATFARPEYEAWWRMWENEGWTSLGRQRNFDWMHVQAAGI